MPRIRDRHYPGASRVPARAAPSSATSGFTMSLVGMALTKDDNPPLSSKRVAERALSRELLDLLGDAAGDIDTSPRTVREREIAGNGTEHRAEHGEGGATPRVALHRRVLISAALERRALRGPPIAPASRYRFSRPDARENSLDRHPALLLPHRLQAATSASSPGANPMWPPSVAIRTDRPSCVRGRKRRIRCRAQNGDGAAVPAPISGPDDATDPPASTSPRTRAPRSR